MPCYVVKTVSVEFNAQSEELLTAAVQELNWTIRTDKYASKFERSIRTNTGHTYLLNLSLGTAVLKERPGAQRNFNILKQTYSKKVVEAVAKKKKWFIKETEKGKLKMRRY